MCCSGVSPAVSVSPLVNPMRIFLTSGEGDVSAPSFRRSPDVGDWPNAALGGDVGLIPKQGSAVGGLAVDFVEYPEGICHEPSPARFSISMTVCGGSCRLE